MLPEALEVAMRKLALLRSAIDERLPPDKLRLVKTLWRTWRPGRRGVKARLIGIDSGFNYIEYRGYALYIVDCARVAITEESEELYDGYVDIDVVSSSNVEYELFLRSLELEVRMLEESVNTPGIVLVDGSLLAKAAALMKARGELELVRAGVMEHPSRVLERLAGALVRLGRRAVFIAKNSNSRDVLRLAKGDVYYFENYTDGAPGYSRPVMASRISGISSIVKGLEALAGLKGMAQRLDVAITYVRLREGGRVYRVEVPLIGDRSGDAEEYIRLLLTALEHHCVKGYPYVLMRADELARITGRDLRRLARLTGVLLDPHGREPLDEVFTGARARY